MLLLYSFEGFATRKLPLPGDPGSSDNLLRSDCSAHALSVVHARIHGRSPLISKSRSSPNSWNTY